MERLFYMAIPMTLLPLQDCKILRPVFSPNDKPPPHNRKILHQPSFWTAHLPDIGISQVANTDNGNDIVLLFFRKIFRQISK